MGTQHADRQGRGTEYVKKDSIKIKILRFDTINSGKKCTFTRMSERTLIIYKECINNIIERFRTRSNNGTKRMMIRVSNIFKAEIKINKKNKRDEIDQQSGFSFSSAVRTSHRNRYISQ